MIHSTHASGLRRILLAAFLSAFLGGSLNAATLRKEGIRSICDARSSRVEIRLDEKINVRVVDEMEGKRYFFLDLYNTSTFLGKEPVLIGDGILKYQTRFYPDQKVVRIIFIPANPTVFRVSDGSTGDSYSARPLSAAELPPDGKRTNHLVIDVPKLPNYALRPLLRPGALSPIQRAARVGSRVKRLVIIDPGHGGKDPGAMSLQTFKGKKLLEKDVALAIAFGVCRLLNKTANVAAELTRRDDYYMTLEKRVDFAEKLDGDLFVSIHANSTKYHRSPTARGVEFYFFSTESRNETRALVEAENAVDRSADSKNLDAAANAHSKLIMRNLTKDILETHRDLGARICEHLRLGFLNDAYFKNHDRGVKSAPFRVLMNMVSPAVLVEVGFIDNSVEAKKLADPAFQRQTAKLIANGILRYFAQQDQEFDYYQFARK